MSCVVSSCNSVLREVREWYAGARVKKELSNFTAIKSMSLYLWMGERKSPTSECRERTALGKKFPNLLPSPFTAPGSYIRLGYCYYPWNCLLADAVMYAAVRWCSEAHQWTRSRSLYWTTLRSLQDLRAHCSASLRDSACILQSSSHCAPHQQVPPVSAGDHAERHKKGVNVVLLALGALWLVFPLRRAARGLHTGHFIP